MDATFWQFELTQPAWLALLMGIPLVVWAARRSLAGLSRTVRWGLAVCQAAAVAAIAMALAQPQATIPTPRRTIAVVVDRSQSVDPAGRSAAERLIDQIRKQAASSGDVRIEWFEFSPPGDSGARTGFAKRQALAGEGTPPRAEAVGARAIAAARARLPHGRVGRIVLLSDGTCPSAHAAAAREAGVPIDTVALPSMEVPEFYVDRLLAPRAVRVGEPIALQLVVRSNRAGSASVELLEGGSVVDREPIELNEGFTSLRLTHRVQRVGNARLGVRLVGRADRIEANNRHEVVVQVEKPPHVLLVSVDPAGGTGLADSLKRSGFVVEREEPSAAPRTPMPLGRYDLVILNDVPAASLEPQQLAAMRTYVRRLGGGLLVIGGERSLTAGGYADSTLERMLPVRCRPTGRQERPTLALALVIDRSESMQGGKIALAKQATRRAVELLQPADQVGVIAFEDFSEWAVPLQPATDKAAVIARVDAMRAAGGTNMYPAIEKAYLALRDAFAENKHIIVLTDGISHPADFHELARRIDAAGISISTIALGKQAGEALLEDVARLGGGRFYLCTNPADVPEVFAVDTATATRLGIYEQPFFGKQAGRLPTAAAEGAQPQHLADAPALLGYVETVPRPAARVVLQTEPGDPLLAWWRYGRGKSGVFTSDVQNRWAAAWLGWPGFDRFWADVASQLLGPGPPRRWQMNARRLAQLHETGARSGEGFTRSAVRFASLSPLAETDAKDLAQCTPGSEGARVGLLGIDTQGRFVTDAEIELEIASPEGSLARLQPPQQAPGYYARRVPTPLAGTWHFAATGRAGGDLLFAENLWLVNTWPEELRLRPTDRDTLEMIAEASGGRVNPTAAEIVAPDGRTAVQVVELWRALLAAGIVFLVAGVMIRRFAPEQDPTAQPGRRHSHSAGNRGRPGSARPTVTAVGALSLGLLLAASLPAISSGTGSRTGVVKRQRVAAEGTPHRAEAVSAMRTTPRAAAPPKSKNRGCPAERRLWREYLVDRYFQTLPLSEPRVPARKN